MAYSQSDAEQARFLSLAIRSLIETVACQHLINRCHYFKDPEQLRNAYQFSEKLFAKLQAFRSSLASDGNIREESKIYAYNDDNPF